MDLFLCIRQVVSNLKTVSFLRMYPSVVVVLIRHADAILEHMCFSHEDGVNVGVGVAEAYRESVLPPSVEARVAVEMGGAIGWDRYVGPKGATVTMSTFGASAPISKLQDKFGFTVANVVALAREVMGK